MWSQPVPKHYKDMTIEALATLVESIAGADPMRASRARPVVEARAILVAALLAGGMSENTAAAETGFNRCTIHHYRDLLRDAEQYGNAPQMLANWRKLKTILDL